MEEVIFKRPELEDRELIESYFAKAPSRSCDRNFVNVYLWSRHYYVTFAIVEDAMVFKDETDGDLRFAYPAGEPENVRKAIAYIKTYFAEKGKPFQMYNVLEEQYAQFTQWYQQGYQIAYNPDLADYVYEQEKLETLSGKKLHGKRNHINKFKTLYEDWQYETLSDENVEECFQMALEWREINGCEDDEEKNAEMCVTLNSLRLFKELGEVGGILRVNGKIAAFTIGEAQNEDTFVVHIEKAFADIEGAYPMINQQFVAHECKDFRYINREEDTGAEGLRKAKLSYRPVFMVEKGVISEA
ncbi:MAG: phosphatidylglycerol lysyltransferase domain-containing protein [Hespellia sp.]|nr:phosphatidylglycerol lysyltransferase domain-containing protein [Hespellia sp.]